MSTSKLTSIDIYNIGIQNDADSYPFRTNFENIKNKINEVIDEVAAASIGTTNAETTAARPYHDSLKNRLDSDWYGQCNYIKNGGIVTISSTGNVANITAGQAKVNGIDVKWDAEVSNSISLAVANSRLDVVVINSSSSITIVSGTEAAVPVFPDIAVSQKPLYYLTVTTTSITATDCRDQGCWFWDEGRWQYTWKIQDAVDEITRGEIFIKKGIYFEEVDLTGKNNITLRFENNAKIKRISATSYCIKSVNTSGNETVGIKIYGADLYGNSQAGSCELLYFQYTDEFIIKDSRFDGNTSSTATFKNWKIDLCNNFSVYQNFPYNSDGEVDHLTTIITGSIAYKPVFNDGIVSGGSITYWRQTGNDLNIASVSRPVITALTSTRVAFIDETNDDLRTYAFDGVNWAQVGNDLNIVGVTYPCITALSSTRIAFIDSTNDDLRTYAFDGTDWAQVGNDLNIANLDGAASITALTSTRIAYMDNTNDDLRTYAFDGTDWAQVGNDLNTNIGQPFLAALSSTRIAMIDITNDDLRVYDFDGTDWSQTGNDLNISGFTGGFIAALSNKRIIMMHGADGDLRVYDFDGTDWSQTGGDFNIASATGGTVTALSSTRIAFIDSTNDDLRTYDGVQTNGNNPPSPVF